MCGRREEEREGEWLRQTRGCPDDSRSKKHSGAPRQNSIKSNPTPVMKLPLQAGRSKTWVVQGMKKSRTVIDSSQEAPPIVEKTRKRNTVQET